MAKPALGAGLTALITGTSSGIGEALAERFAKAGFQLVLVARQADKLQALAATLKASHGVKAWAAPADLSQPGRWRRPRSALGEPSTCSSTAPACSSMAASPPCRHAAAPPRCHQGLIALNVGGSAGLQRLPGIVVGSVDEVADQGFAACMQGEVMRVPGALNRAAAVAGRTTPKWLLRRVSGALVRGLR